MLLQDRAEDTLSNKAVMIPMNQKELITFFFFAFSQLRLLLATRIGVLASFVSHSLPILLFAVERSFYVADPKINEFIRM